MSRYTTLTLQWIGRDEHIRINRPPVTAPPPGQDLFARGPDEASVWAFVNAIMLGNLNHNPESASDSDSSRSDDTEGAQTSAQASRKRLVNTPASCTTKALKLHSTLPGGRIKMATAREIYGMTPFDKEITTPLPSAVQLLRCVRSQRDSNPQHLLLRSKRFTKDTIKNHLHAAKHANRSMIAGIEATLSAMLITSPNRSMSITVQGLEKELTQRMKQDCVNWIERWIIERPLTRGSDRWELLAEYERENRGIAALVDKAEDCVRDVVGLLIWLG
jgi:hypothetical protein